MSNFIPEEILEEIQMRTDIVDVISHYIPLKKTGSNYKALCPFHNENTPSFIVSPSKQIFHCFGCGAGGNAFGFVMQYEHIGFVDAVKLLAERAGVEIPNKYNSSENKELKGLWELNKFAMNCFHEWLLKTEGGSRARRYLKRRGINDTLIKQFKLGFSPTGNQLLKRAKDKGFSVNLLKQAGLIVRGSSKDIFRNRLMFPIFNTVGKPIGFSGRVLDDSLPKYINTPETKIFQKGKILYGLNFSKADIIKQNLAVICEGYFDYIRLYKNGVTNIVASQGTAFTDKQVHLLSRYTREIVTAFDSDAAGSKAAIRGLDKFLTRGIRVRVARLPEPYDPDTFIKKKGIEDFKKLIDNADGVLNVKLSGLCKEYGTKRTEDKLNIIEQILPDIAKINNSVWKHDFVKNLSAKIKVPEESIWIELKKTQVKSKPDYKRSNANSPRKEIMGEPGASRGERHLAQLLLDDNPLPDFLKRDSFLPEMQSKEYKIILELILEHKGENKWKGISRLMEATDDEKILKLLSKLASHEICYNNRDKAIKDCLYDIKKRYRERQIKKIIENMQELEKSDQGSVADLIKEVNELKKELIQLEKKFKKQNESIFLEDNDLLNPESEKEEKALNK